MTVQQLINRLQELDPNAIVFRNGYEGGYDEVNSILLNTEMALDVYDSPYFGSHDRLYNLDQEQLEGKVIVKGIII
jgi:hypothetical protein